MMQLSAPTDGRTGSLCCATDKEKVRKVYVYKLLPLVNNGNREFERRPKNEECKVKIDIVAERQEE